MTIKDGCEYVAKAERLEYCPQWGEDCWSWRLVSDYSERIIRCRDCKRHSKNQIPNKNGWIICERGGVAVSPDGFCAWGVSRWSEDG